MLFLPGPNNLLLMASSANFGWRATLPHVFGTVIGATLLMAMTVIGLSSLIIAIPVLIDLLKYGGAIWLVWFGIKYLKSAFTINITTETNNRKKERPFTYGEAAVFQWVNPSALIFTIAIASAFSNIADSTIMRCLSICLIFAIVALLATISWTTMGRPFAFLFNSKKTGSIVRATMGILIIFIAFKTTTY